MRAVPVELAARLDSGAACLCHAWVLTRADGVTLGFTDHDRDLVVDGVTCRAATGWTAGAHETAAGFAPGLSAALGALDDAAVTAGDLEAGLYDGASVDGLQVDWSLPTLFVRLWTARIARIRREGEAFKQHPHIVLVPGAVLFLTVFSFNLLGEKARKRFDPRAAKL